MFLKIIHVYSVSEKARLYRLPFKVWCLFLADIRSNGISAHTVGMALVFSQQVSESDAGLYTCGAFWYHHNATVTVLVDVTKQEIHSSEYLLFVI